VSANGGTQPSWSDDGRTLYYLSRNDELIAVAVETDPTFRAGEPVVLMQVDAYPGTQRKYDVSADGSRVLWNEVAGGSSEADPLTLVLGWEALLRDRR
jgi:hypothetical protein